MDANVQPGAGRGRGGLRRVWVVLCVLLAALLIFHRPLLLSIGRAVAIHYAAKAGLKVDFRAEGTVFTNLIIRNLHVLPTEPTTVESIDVDFVRADYSLIDWIRFGASEMLKNVEVRSARIVLNTDKTPVKPKIPKPDERITLPTLFPEQVRLSDVNLIIRTTPQDFVIEHLYLDLLPRAPGELRIATLKIPNAEAWKNLSAQTSYTNKNLVLRGLVLDEANQIRLLAIDASHIRTKSLEMAFDASVAGGTLAGSIGLSQTPTSLDTRVRMVSENISLDTLSGYIGKAPGILGGRIERVEMEASGTIDVPRSWQGAATVHLADVQHGKFVIDRCDASVAVRNGRAILDGIDLTRGLDKIHLQGSAELPAHIRQFGRSPATLDFSGDFPDLAALTNSLQPPITGAASLRGRVDIVDATLRANIGINGNQIASGTTKFETLNGSLKLSKKMPPTDVKKAYYGDLRSEVHLDINNVQSTEYLADSVHVDITSADELVAIEQVALQRKQNSLVLRGEYRLPEAPAEVERQPAKIEAVVKAAQLADFWIAESPDKISGSLEASAAIVFKDRLADGQLSLYGSNLALRTLIVSQLSTQCSIAKSVVYVNDFTARLSERDFIAGSAVVALQEPYRYTGRISANISDLATLKPLLAATGNDQELGGALTVDWQGNGNAAEFKNTGTLKLKLEHGSYGNLQSLQANVDATYTPDALDVPIVFLASDKMDFQASVQAKGATLEISKIQIDQGKAKYGVGYLSVPFVWSNLATERPLFPANGKVAGSFQSENLDLKRLFQDFGVEPPLFGSMNVKIDAQGTLENLQARMDLQMRELRSEKFKEFEPASLDLALQTQNNQLALTGKLQQARIQPLQLQAKMPLNLAQIAHDRRFDETTPITAKLTLPRSPVNFLRQVVPPIQELDGSVALDVNINGTIAQPVFSGAGDLTINVARFNNPTLPALHDFRSRLLFNRDTLTFERFGGDLAGGPFTLGGRVVFEKLTNPTLDFQLKARSVLVARNDTLTARADADLRVDGPLGSATVAGNVALTNSQFLKNIDLIPIGLPGRPAPQPPSDRPSISITTPPIRDWKFDVSIKTKDPFLIRGNLANGAALVDLHLGGTGLHPLLEGQVRLKNVEATLPFSRLEVQSGFLFFDPSDPLNPKIDLQGTSLIRDYTVHVYVYGTTLSPEAIFTSEPPLPQEEIISLLATGTTREELTGNSNVLAGRAATLLVQQLYRKFFKKGEPAKSNSVFDRLQVDVGTVDPRTGQQTVTARYKINQQFVLVGDIGVGGEFRGLVKYLIRFR